ncbi:MAG: hypothetical protein CVV61_07665 [Tenericutes bacterium HGW-Tenericutes-6]|nr:MAG: hypothetical protein CVV61_07665 [Tenericutes bacterium HGW-Tenericutes-6]
MKKITAIIMLILLSIGLIGCENIDYDVLFDETSEQIEALMPDKINASFEMPFFDGVDVSFDYNDVSFGEGEFVYESPFYDQDVELNYIIRRGNRAKEYTKTIHLVAKESGHNEYKIMIDLPYSVNNVTDVDYTQASITAVMTKNDDIVTELETDAAQIRGRGNSTWFSYPKKPFKIKFDEKTSLFGMKDSRDYVLLAEYADKSLMRNTIVQKMSSLSLYIPYTVETRFVELYINTVYFGVYVLTEQIEFQGDKLDVESIAGTANTGYLFELDKRLYDKYDSPNINWFEVGSQPYDIVEPNNDEPLYSDVHKTYLTLFMNQVEDALMNKTGYEEYIDVDAWIDYFIIQELTKNVDVGFSSVFLYKEANGPLKPGPLWDFDFAMGNADYIDYGPEGFYGMMPYKNRLFKLLLDIPEVRQKFAERYSDFYYDILPEIIEMIPVLASSIEDQAQRNFDKWQIMDIYVWPNPVEMLNEHTFMGQVDYVKSYLELRGHWMLAAVHKDNFAYIDFD